MARYVVNTLEDQSDGALGDGLSLREAVALANAAVGADDIGFAVSGVIRLTQGEIGITDALTIDGGELTIEGDYNYVPRVTLDAEGRSRVLRIDDGTDAHIDVTLQNLTVTGGKADAGGGIWSDEALTLSGMTVSGNIARDAGGGVASQSGPLAIVFGSQITENSVTNGNDLEGGQYLYQGGGGVFSGGDLFLLDSGVTGNSLGTGSGGGVRVLGHAELEDAYISNNFFTAYDVSGAGISAATTLTMRFSTVTGNKAQYAGGGVEGQDILIESSVISGNSNDGVGARGGGVAGDRVRIFDSEINNNRVGGNEYTRGGGVFGRDVEIHSSEIIGNSATGFTSYGGGGVFATQLLMTESLVSDNATDGRGGGVQTGFGRIVNSTITGNSIVADGIDTAGIHAGTLILESATISGNWVGPYGGNIAGVSASNATIINSIVTANKQITYKWDQQTEQQIFDVQPADLNVGTLKLEGGNLIDDIVSLDGEARISSVSLDDVFRDFRQLEPQYVDDLRDGLVPAVADNGGERPSIALLPSPQNPAIDAGLDSLSAGTAFDTRGAGFARIVDLPGVGGPGAVDLGSFELQTDEFPVSGSPILIEAAGSGGPGGSPRFTVFADGVAIGAGEIANPAATLGAAAFETFGFEAPVAPSRLDIVFENDGRALDGTDINLRVGAVVFGGQTYSPCEDGVYVREGGEDLGPQRSMYWNGTLGFSDNSGQVVTVVAAGTGDAEVAPEFRVLADGVEIGRGEIAAPAENSAGLVWESFEFRYAEQRPAREIVVEFLNDQRTPTSRTDVNLFVDTVAFGGETFTASEDATYIRAHDGADLGPARSMWWNGALYFEAGEEAPVVSDLDWIG